MTNISDFVIVISYYDRRPLEPLAGLLDSIRRHSSALATSRIVVVVNSTGAEHGVADVVPEGVAIVSRPNFGMNIGAWDAGYRAFSDFSRFIFLQDECFVAREGWLQGLLSPLDDPAVGLVGESLNRNWDRPWARLREENQTVSMPEHTLSGRPANRVDVYLEAMGRWGINPGQTGLHLRSLVWATRRDVLQAIGGFPSGANYGECIAAEIAVSRSIVSKGYVLTTPEESPFHYVRHIEWNQDVAGGPFTHKAVLKEQLQRLKAERLALADRISTLEARVRELEGGACADIKGRLS